jgi:rhamnosyltransferase
MTEHSVCAVIVTFHPDAVAVANILDIIPQVGSLVVVDNGSDAGELAPLRLLREKVGFHLIENEENLGIAHALNQGVLWARSMSYPWVILFDQDSRITPGFVIKMFATWNAHPYRERVCSIHPSYIEPATGISPPVRLASDGGPVTSMTSGALMPVWVFDRIGMFASDYFIDLVDCEYCFRIRAAGFSIASSQEAVLLHAAGEPKRISFLGFNCQPSNHSAVRRYYIARNRFVVYRKYLRVFPRWILYSLYEASRETMKCFIVEDDRSRKIRNSLLGLWDGFLGRMGKREHL